MDWKLNKEGGTGGDGGNNNPDLVTSAVMLLVDVNSASAWS